MASGMKSGVWRFYPGQHPTMVKTYIIIQFSHKDTSCNVKQYSVNYRRQKVLTNCKQFAKLLPIKSL